MFLSVSPIERLAPTEVGNDEDNEPAEFAEAIVADGFTMKDFTV